MRCEDSMILCLQQAVNLNTLTTGIVPDSFNISERITLPRLESWQVLDYFWLRCFKTPALQNLCLHGHRAIQINAIVTSFLRESGCKLARLALTRAYKLIRPSVLIEILRHAPELVHLELNEYDDKLAACIELLSVPIPSDLVSPELPVQVTNYWRRDINRIIDRLLKLLLVRNGDAANNGGRPVKRLKLLILGKN